MSGSGSVDVGVLFEAAAQVMQQAHPGDISENKANTLRSLCGGSDVQLIAPKGTERVALYGAWVSAVAGVSVIVCGTAADGEELKGCLAESKVAGHVIASSDEFKSALSATSGCLIVPVAVAAAAFKAPGTKPVVARCVVDGIEPIIEHVSLTELESFLLGFREVNGDSQMVIIAQEASLHLSALSRRFLREPKHCSIKGVSVEDMTHVYYEVGTSLLAKPQALCDLVELEAGSTCVVFCNSPSDADFADVILKKRGLSSLKLIGYVPQLKLSKAIHQIQKREVMILVLTDVAARGVPLEDFDVVVNYSIPTDPEVYFHRYAPGSESKTKKVISLVAPLDLSNFHYLKKLGKMEFVQAELPTPEQLFVSKFSALREQAIERPFMSDPSIATLVEKVLSDAQAKDIVALLLHNTVSVLPSLKSSAGKDEGHDSDEEMGDEGDRRPNRGGRGQQDNRGGGRGRDRDNRRGDSRGGEGRGDFRNEGRGGEGRNFDGGGRGRNDDVDSGYDSDERADDRGGDDQAPRGRGRGRDRDNRDNRDSRDTRGRDRDNDRGDRGDRGDRDGDQGGEGRGRGRQPRRQMMVDKEARIYIGAGSKQGVSIERVTNDVIAACGVQATEVHRVSVRDCYTFVDVPEAIADQVVEKLGEVEVNAGDRYFVKRAVTLSIPREGAQEEGSNEQDGHDNDRDHGQDHGQSFDDVGGDRDQDVGDDGPTLLSVDDPA